MSVFLVVGQHISYVQNVRQPGAECVMTSGINIQSDVVTTLG